MVPLSAVQAEGPAPPTVLSPPSQTYESRIQQLENEIQKRDTRIAELENSLKHVSSDELSRLQAEITTKDGRIQDLTLQITSLSDQMKELLQDSEQSRQKIQSLESLQMKLTREISNHSMEPPLSSGEDGDMNDDSPELNDDTESQRNNQRLQQIQRLERKISKRHLEIEPFPSVDDDEQLPIPDHLPPIQIPVHHDKNLKFEDVFSQLQDFRRDIIIKYREMAGNQDRAVQSMESYQIKTLNTLTGEESGPPPHEHSSFDRFRRRLLEMSRRVLQLSGKQQDQTAEWNENKEG